MPESPLRPVLDPLLLAQREARASQFAVARARAEASAAAALAEDLRRELREREQELEQALAEPSRLAGEIAQRVRERVRAEQAASDERGRREEVELALVRARESVVRLTDRLEGIEAAHRDRTAELREEVRRLTRARDEAEHLVRIVLARRLGEGEAGSPGRPRPRRAAPGAVLQERTLEAELALARAPLRMAVGVVSRGRAASSAVAGGRPGRALRGEQALLARRERVPIAPARALPAEPEPVPPPAAESAPAPTAAAAGGAPARQVLAPPATRPWDAPAPAPPARPAGTPTRARSAREPIDPERLMAALERLRRTIPLPGAEPAADVAARGAPPVPPFVPVRAEPPARAEAPRAEPPPRGGPPPEDFPAPPRAEAPPPDLPAEGEHVTDWLARALAVLTDEDPATAGEVILALLDAQHLIDPGPLAYDLILGVDGLVRVTVLETATLVERLAPRPSGSVWRAVAPPRHPSEVDFQVLGDLPGLARLLVAGQGRRRTDRDAARVRGDRARFAALEQLVSQAPPLSDLLGAGMQLDPYSALALAGAMIDPAWTVGRFATLGHRAPTEPGPRAFLRVFSRSAGRATIVPPAGRVQAVIECEGRALLPLLAGVPGVAHRVEGDRNLLSQVRAWVARAQRRGGA